MAEMTKGERTELRQAVRLQFKVLRSEVLQREAEVTDSILDEVEEEFHERSELEAKVLREFATLVGWPPREDPMSDRRSLAQDAAVRARVDLEEQARLDECEILEFLRVAREFPEFFPPARRQ
jgi:hypothetical protein